MFRKIALLILLMLLAIFLVAASPASAGQVNAEQAVAGSELDLVALVSAALTGSGPVFVAIFGLVEFVRTAGLRDLPLLLASMAIGLLLGLAYLIASLGVPADFGAWFAFGIVAITYGLVASGVVKMVKRLVEGAAAKAAGKPSRT